MTRNTENAADSKALPELEFIALMAFLMSNVALSIDAVLPALTDIGTMIHNEDSSNLQYIISMIFLGLGVGQITFGTLSDSYGRKPVVLYGVAIFIAASFICIAANSLEMMLLGRLLQGVGLAAPKTISISIIRDTYAGDYMARIMSFIAVVFIIVPMIAPVIGQLILHRFGWQAIFYFQLLFISITILWFYSRQRETLAKDKRVSFSIQQLVNGLKMFMQQKSAVLCTLVSGLLEGAFIFYLSSSKLIFQDQYGFIDTFPYIFAGMAFVLGLSTFFNGSLVLRYGMKRLINIALSVFTFTSLLGLLFFWKTFGAGMNPPFEWFILFLLFQFLSFGFLFGNISALAMQRIGHIAGMGASIFSFISTTLGVLISILIGLFMQETVLPLFAGFFICGVLALLVFRFLFLDKTRG